MSDAELPNPSDGEPADDHFQPPRLRILHLLAWMTVATVIFKFNLAVSGVIARAMAGTAGRVIKNWSVAYRAIALTQVIMYAAGFVGLGILVAARFRRRPGRLQPGHWMLVVEVSLYAATRIPDVVLLLTYLIQQGASFRLPSWYMRLNWEPLVVPCLCRASLYYWASIRTIDGWRWRALFVCLAILAVIAALWPALAWVILSRGWFGMRALVAGFPIPVNAVLCLTLLAVVLADLRVPRDWVHWLGVAVVGGGAALGLVSSVCYVFLPRI